ncbi:AMP-binding protein [Streptomyces sp. NPDC001118]
MSFIETLVSGIKQHGPATAVIERGNSFTYDELDRVSAEICGGLIEQGVRQNDIVCVYAPRTWQRCTAVLGAWRAGAGVLSIDPGMPAARIDRILGGASPVLVVRDTGAPRLKVDAAQYSWNDVRRDARDDLFEGHVGYAIATSGSTGQPKTVAVSAVTLENLARWHVDHWRHSDTPHTLHAASIGFDVIYEEMVATWLAGAELVLVDDQQRRDPFALIELIQAHGVRRMFTPVGALHSLAMVAEAIGAELPTLREIAVAGERLLINDEVRAFCRASGIELINQYGPSETHLITQHRLSGEPADWPDQPPIGSAVVGAELMCLDGGELRPFRPQETAEIVVAGDCVAIGYLGDEALTAERFKTLPHQDGRKRRCYFTGDQATFDGQHFHFVGRLDDQLKVNGYRVEPGEVEAVISAVQGIRRVSVMGVPTNAGTTLVAFYSTEPGAALTAAEVRTVCSSALPEYMVPADIVEIEAFPVTENGKVDRRKLIGMLNATRPHE